MWFIKRSLWLCMFVVIGCSGARSSLKEPLDLDAGSDDYRDAAGLTPCGSDSSTCDVTNLGGATCASLGLGSGTLSCDEADCTFDTAGCSLAAAGGGADPAADGGS